MIGAERQRQIQSSIHRMGGMVRKHLQSAADMLKDMHARLSGEAELDAKRTEDAAHQLRLSSAMKTLELRGGAMNKADFFELVSPLSFDIGAQQAIKAAASAGGMNSWTAAIWLIGIFEPAEVRKTAIAQLQAFAEYIEHCWDDMTTYDSVTGSDMEFVFAHISSELEHWNDALTKFD